MKAIVAGCLIAIAAVPAFTQYNIIGYYPSWKRASFPASKLPLSSLSCVIHAFAWPGIDGSLQTGDGVPDAALVTAVHGAKKKLLLSLGGAGNDSGFDTVSVHPERRSVFVKNVVLFLSENHYDGLDIDWEQPGTNAQRDSMVSMIRELRSAFDSVNTEYLITAAIPVTDYFGRWYNFPALLPYMNWFNAMTYDYHGSWSSHAGHNAPLYAPNDAADYSVDQSIQYLLNTRHIPKEKLVLGIPFYGKRFQAVSLLTPFSGEEDLTYAEVVDTVSNGGWVYHWDDGAQVPYYTNGSSIITFDDSTSVSAKCSYAKSRQLAGVMIWELSQDVIASGQPLFGAIVNGMTTGVDASRETEMNTAKSFVLLQNYPNPFNPATTITFTLTQAAEVHLAVFDPLGREVASLFNGLLVAGEHSTVFRAENISSGIYYLRLTAGTLTAVNKLMVLK